MMFTVSCPFCLGTTGLNGNVGEASNGTVTLDSPLSGFRYRSVDQTLTMSSLALV